MLVLGGGSEIALATVRALVADRARSIVLAARRPHELEPVAAELRAAGATVVELIHFDALDTDGHRAFVEQAFARQEDLDLVIVAFGMLGEGAEHDEARAVEVARTNYVGAVSVSLSVARRLERQGHGTLVILSSVAAERARASSFVYGSTKAGLDAFAQGLGDSLEGTGARVMVVRPGFVRTKMTAGLEPAPFSTTPQAVADATVAGLRRGAHTVWAPPVLRIVMAGLRHLPRPLYRRIAAKR